MKTNTRHTIILLTLLLGIMTLSLAVSLPVVANHEHGPSQFALAPTKTAKPTALPKPTATPTPLFQLDVDGVVCVRGHGTAVIGRVEQGNLKPGDTVRLTRNGKVEGDTVIDAIQTFWTKEGVGPGQTVGLLLRDFASSEARSRLETGRVEVLGSEAIVKAVPTVSHEKQPFRMTVQEVKSRTGGRIEITGVVEGGKIQPGMEIQFARNGKPLLSARVIALEPVDSENPRICDTVGLLFRDVNKSNIRAKDVLLEEESPTPEPDDKPFKMTIQGVFSIPGRGTVVTGRVESGSLQPLDWVEIRRSGKETLRTQVTSIEMFGKTEDKASKGDNVGLSLRGISRDEIDAGDVIVRTPTNTQ